MPINNDSSLRGFERGNKGVEEFQTLFNVVINILLELVQVTFGNNSHKSTVYLWILQMYGHQGTVNLGIQSDSQRE